MTQTQQQWIGGCFGVLTVGYHPIRARWIATTKRDTEVFTAGTSRDMVDKLEREFYVPLKGDKNAA